MALRATLSEVVEMVRDEAKLSTNSSRGTDHLSHIQRLIKRHYTSLAEEHDWQHLNLKRNDSAARKVLQAGSRHYDFPASVNPLKIERAWVKWSGIWHPLTFGIDYGNYNGYDPAEDQRVDPITHWGFHTGTQFEVWPIPATNGTADDDNEVAFEGQKQIEALTSNNSRLDMDDILVSLYAAAEILAGKAQKDAAAVKAAAAERRLSTLRGNLGSKRRIAIGIGTLPEGDVRMPRHPTYVR